MEAMAAPSDYTAAQPARPPDALDEMLSAGPPDSLPAIISRAAQIRGQVFAVGEVLGELQRRLDVVSRPGEPRAMVSGSLPSEHPPAPLARLLDEVLEHAHDLEARLREQIARLEV